MGKYFGTDGIRGVANTELTPEFTLKLGRILGHHLKEKNTRPRVWIGRDTRISGELLESALIDFEGTILFVSHDRYFINQVADTVLEITPEGSNLYLGNYDYYLEKKAELEAIEAAKEAEQSQDDQQVSKTSQKQLDYKKSKELQKQQRKLQRLVDDAESEMERLEELKTNIEQEMTLPDNFNDPQKMDELHTKLSKATNDLNEAESKWTELSLELEGLQ